MNVVLVGAGNLATNLALGLHDAGLVVTQVYSRTMRSASVLANAIGAEATDQMEQVRKDADLYIISIKDDALGHVISQLCQGREEKMFLHTAGSMPMDVFAGHCQHYGVFYPMQTFSKDSPVSFSEIPCFIEGANEEDTSFLKLFAGKLSKKVICMNSQDRKRLHLAAVFACNFANHCFAIGEQMVTQMGLSRDVLEPLIKRTVEKLQLMPARDAQTGPAVRYDENVIGKHLAFLSDIPQLRQVYAIVSESIHEMALSGE